MCSCAFGCTGQGAGFAQWAPQVTNFATLCVYILAGIPQLVSLCFSLSVGHVDTHVLMTLAVFGTLAIGGALEVRPVVLFCSLHLDPPVRWRLF